MGFGRRRPELKQGNGKLCYFNYGSILMFSSSIHVWYGLRNKSTLF